MEEIKVGEYVRTKNKGIKRIDTIFENKTVNKYGYEIGSEWDGKLYSTIKTTDIVKHSSNIIDLIEDGDYVNGYFIEENRGRYLKTDEIDYSLSSLGHLEPLELNAEEIKWVITREQIEEMKYIVKE